MPMQRLDTFPYFKTWLIALIVLVLALSFGGLILFIGSVTKPLYVLKALMNRAERGDLRAYWTFKSSNEWTQVGESYNQMLNRLEDLIKQVKREESLKKEAEMEALHYQLNPHFLYNTLNTIKWVAKIHKTPQISEVVSALVRLLQASLGKKGDFITLRDEIRLTHDYMEIQRFRYGDRIGIDMQVDEITLGCLVPRMLLQPLVENAIIHGIGPTKNEGKITIKSWLDRDLLFCQVEDNGVGMQVEEGNSGWNAMQARGGAQAERMLKERMSGVGISHIREKIKLIYGPEYKMHISSKPGEGTTIRMFLPIHQGEE
ncbi:Sensor histidine kinase YehU [compost metagenome]